MPALAGGLEPIRACGDSDERFDAEALQGLGLLRTHANRTIRRYTHTVLNSFSNKPSRIWRARRFSAWMTTMLHARPGIDEYQKKMQLAEVEYVIRSSAAARSLAKNYVGIPLPTEALQIPRRQLVEHCGLTF